MNRGALFWGLALVTAGAVALAVQVGWLSREALGDAWRWWPVILIAFGVALVAARSAFGWVAAALAGIVAGLVGGALLAGAGGTFIGCSGGSMTQQLTRDGDFTGNAAEISLDIPCGTLAVEMQPGTAWEADLQQTGGREPNLEVGEDRLEIRAADDGPFSGRRSAWRVTLPTDPTLDLSIDANAADADLALADGRFARVNVDANAAGVTVDIAGAELDDLSIDANAGSVQLTVDEETALAEGSVEMNAGSLEICAPDGATLAIDIGDDDFAFSHNLDDAGLVQRGTAWVSDGTDPDAARVRFSVGGNAASLSLNAEDACA